MDEEYYEKRVLSILSEREGYEDEYDSIHEFKQHSNDAALAEEHINVGWVLWRETEGYQQQYLDTYHSNNTTVLLPLQHKIITLLNHIASYPLFGHDHHCLVQFWGVEKVEGRYHHLSTSNQPFFVSKLSKGASWYRHLCVGLVFHVDMEGAEVEQLLGGVGRAYRNMQPESTPDLRLYSTNQFPLRDDAARCGFRAYMALPLFDLHQNQCYGVLELLSQNPTTDTIFSVLSDRGLKIAELSSTHIHFNPLRRFTMTEKYMNQPVKSEIREILEVAIKAVPHLSLAQVWVPCKQCPNMSTNLRCMERVSFINDESKMINICAYTDDYMFDYLQACEFHNLQIDLNCLSLNFCDLSLSKKNPLAHYAVRARLSLCLTICLQSVNNCDNLYVIEFFLQPKCREDASGDSSLHLLLRIIEMKLESFIFVSREQLPKELLVQSRQPNASECESIDKLNVMNCFEEKISKSNFTAYLETVDSVCLKLSSCRREGWVFCGAARQKLIEDDVKSKSSLVVPMSIKEKIEDFMKNTSSRIGGTYWIVQFWAPKMAEDRCYLETSDQPYVVGCLAKGLASFRKECIKHHYFVDKETKEEELGPPGRVYRNGNHEITPDLFLYSTEEFSMRNYAAHCGLKAYFALPVFENEKLESKCVGVLEFVGLEYYCELNHIGSALKAAKLHSIIHINVSRKMTAKQKLDNKNLMKALGEVRNACGLIKKIPHLHKAKVWVPYDEYASIINGNLKCMKEVWNTKYAREYRHAHIGVHWIHVQPKKGIIGMVLESESKSCFCQNLSEFSIVDQPLSHFQRRERIDVCFAICLQSSHTGDLLFVLEFFLNPSPHYLQSFFRFLLPIIKHQLKSFKMASGKPLGEEFVVEVIKFSEENQLTSSDPDLPDMFPIKFKSVLYGQEEHPYTEEQQKLSIPYATQTEQYCNANDSNLKRAERGKRKTGLHHNLEVLKPHFRKKLKDVAQELCVGRSTIKRDMQTSTSNNIQPLDMSLHQNVPHANTETTQHLIVQEAAEKVIIKVKFEEDIIKFELCLSLGLEKLFEEVATRLNLKMGTFKLKYLDGDNDEILLTCDADLQYCSNSQIATGKSYIQLFVR